jgi:hypothetical protein
LQQSSLCQAPEQQYKQSIKALFLIFLVTKKIAKKNETKILMNWIKQKFTVESKSLEIGLSWIVCSASSKPEIKK